jgi:hypothetical protein
MMSRLALLGAVVLTSLSMMQSPGIASAATDGADGQPDVVNTLDYVLNTHGTTLNGTHALSQTVVGHTIYNVLWDSDSYETLTFDNNYIYLPEDHSAGQTADGSYTLSDGRWMRRTMTVGDQLVVPGNYVQHFTPGGTSCTPTSSGYFPYVMTLAQHIPQDNLGGTLGTQNVIVLKYDYEWGTGTDYEKIYYAKGWGMVKWELYRNGQVIQASTFNSVTSTPPTPPNLANACISTPVSNAAPHIPASLSEFVRTLYSCILTTSQPDTKGFNFWLGNLQAGAVSIESIYADFFASQPATVTADDFVGALYKCTLFRTIDSASRQALVTGLRNGTLSRANLVQTVLGSQEFEARILPLLRHLEYPVPQIPTSLSGFVRVLYSCALGTSQPDTSGFNYWLGELQSHAVSIQTAYTDFFLSQPSAFTNGDFAVTLFDCMLFRPIDPPSEQNVLAGLQDGHLTRAGLVQFVLSSPEFTGTDLPQLQQRG